MRTHIVHSFTIYIIFASQYVKLPKLGIKKLPQPTLKGFLGGLGRFAIIMFVIQPIIQKPLTKLFHKIFGEPKTYLAKQKAEDKSKTVQQSPSNQNNQVNPFETNLIKKWTQPVSKEEAGPIQNMEINNSHSSGIAATSIDQGIASDSQPLKPQKDSQVAALNIFNKDKKEDDSRYIPSIEPIVIVDNSKEIQEKVNAILKSTDKVVEKTKQYL